MRLFQCPDCGQVVHFENRWCERCGHRLGYLSSRFAMEAMVPDAPGQDTPGPDGEVWRGRDGRRFRFCENAELDACNWLLPAEGSGRFCPACRHNRTVPDLKDPGKVAAWQKMETAKHRLIYTLQRLGLPLPNRADEPEGLVFDFLADPPQPDGPKVMTGHDDGLITLALTEADDAERERRRSAMGEPYRTLVGHFRHEVGHFYWDRLVRDGGMTTESRAVFGDDRADYGEALRRHYREGPPDGWQSSFITAYAAAHPWEDFAETWAHYLHIVDTLETAWSYGVAVHPVLGSTLETRIDFDPYAPGPFDRLIEAWLPLTMAMNGVNRSMGLPDLYPFVIGRAVIAKLAFMHRLVHRGAEAQEAA